MPGPHPVAVSDSLQSSPVLCAHLNSALLRASGDDAIGFLHGQLSNDVNSLAPGRGQYWSYNSPKGRVLANGVLWRSPSDRESGISLILANDLIETIRRRLSMFVLRAKVTLEDTRERYALLGVAGSGAAEAVKDALGIAPAPATALSFNGDATAFTLPDQRVLVACPTSSAPIIHAALARHAVAADAETWRWYAIRAGVPKITTPTSDLFVPQSLNWDLIGGISFQKGCYPGQEIVARMQYLGRLKERTYAFRSVADSLSAGTRLYSSAFGEQACGTVLNAASDPAGGTVLLAVVQQAAVDADDLRVGAQDGATLSRMPLPYTIPEASAPRTPRAL